MKSILLLLLLVNLTNANSTRVDTLFHRLDSLAKVVAAYASIRTKIEIVEAPVTDTTPSKYKMEILREAKRANEIAGSTPWSSWIGSLAGIMALFISLWVAWSTNRQSEKQLRGYIDIQPELGWTNWKLADQNVSFDVSFHIKNVGQTPAKNLEIYYELHKYDKSQAKYLGLLPDKGKVVFGSLVMLPQTLMMGESTLQLNECHLSPYRFDDYNSNRKTIVFETQVKVRYTDIFGKNRMAKGSWWLLSKDKHPLLFDMHRRTETIYLATANYISESKSD